jgi:hypothetical protein
MKRRGHWLIVNRSGPVPVFFCMAMLQGRPVRTLEAKHATPLPDAESCQTVMEEWDLRDPWHPEDHTLQPGTR